MSSAPWRRPPAQLLLLCALLITVHVAATRRGDHEVHLTAEDIARAVRLQEDLVGAPLSPEERQQLIDRIVEDELLVREAFRLGIDRGDVQVRGALIAAMHAALLPAAGTLAEPTASELTAYFEEHRDRYRVPESVSFEHVDLPFGVLDPDGERALLEELRAGRDPKRSIDELPLARHGTAPRMSRRAASRAAGRRFADEVFEARQGQWSGPISSRQGVHFVLIMERHELRDREFNEVEHYLSQDWLADMRFVDFEPELARLRRRYLVRIEGERP